MAGTNSPPAPDDRPGEDPFALAEALVGAQRWDAALGALGPALAAHPEDPRGLGLLVRSLRGAGRRDDALGAARRMLTVSPEDPYGFRLATLVLLDVGWVDEAIGLASRAVVLDPLNAANHLALSRAWGQSTHPDAVGHQLAAAREAVLLEPNSPDAQVQIGVALAAEADIDGARAAYLRALSLDPGNSAALNNLAVLDLQSGAHDAAARGLAAALAADPQGTVARRNLDAMAVRVLRRVGWWLALSPVPALVAAGQGHPGIARVLAAAVLLALPLTVLRWWRALIPGQRRILRSLPRRLRAASWVWPAITAVAGGWALTRILVGAESVTTSDLVAYLTVVGYLVLFRVVAAVLRPSWRAEVAARWARWRRPPGSRG
jgi:tetratricopeptide (TPR) repeat protein